MRKPKAEFRREDLRQKYPVREANGTSAVYIHASREHGDAHIPAVQIFAALENGNLFHFSRRRRTQHAAGFVGQRRAIFHSELREKRGNVKFHGSHRNVQLGGNFLVRAVANHEIQNFALPGTEGGGMAHRAALHEKLFCARQHIAGDGVLCRDKNHEIVGVIAPREALHGK